jgi:membrane protease YdiL (CAAX protease family)
MKSPTEGASSKARLAVFGAVVLFWVAHLALSRGAGLALADSVLLSLLLVAAPVLSLAQLPAAEETPVERLPAYWGSIGALWLLGSAAWLVGTRTGGMAAIGLVAIPAVRGLGWAALLVVLGLAIIVCFRQIASWAGVRDSALLRQLLPHTRRERSVFALLSLTAGLAEEVAYRGFAITALASVTGTAGAVAVSSIVFGILHGYQGVLGTIRTALMGAVLAWGFLASGSLWPPILAHVAIDLLAGIVLGERLLSSPDHAERALIEPRV